MNFSNQLDLPFELECFRKQLETSLLPSNIIEPYFQKSTLLESKFAGFPYLPTGYTYPKDIDGHYMFLLAQINFSKVKLNSPFPKKGLLQFFVSHSFFDYSKLVEEHIFQHYFKLRYYPSIFRENEIVNDFSFLPSISKPPIEQEMVLSFRPQQEPVSATDYRLEQFMDQPFNNNSNRIPNGRSFEDIYLEHFLGAEHKLGGYPYFIFQDTRNKSQFLRRFDTLLLQIISNDEQKIMWGNSGNIKFLINRQKLAKLDFSEVYLFAEQYD